MTFNGSLGFVIPSTSAILAGVQEDYNAAFGGDLNSALDTPQGQLISSETAITPATMTTAWNS